MYKIVLKNTCGNCISLHYTIIYQMLRGYMVWHQNQLLCLESRDIFNCPPMTKIQINIDIKYSFYFKLVRYIIVQCKSFREMLKEEIHHRFLPNTTNHCFAISLTLKNNLLKYKINKNVCYPRNYIDILIALAALHL